MLLDELIIKLKDLKDNTKAEFDKKIVHTSKADFLGVKTSDLKIITKDIIKNNNESKLSFISYSLIS